MNYIKPEYFAERSTKELEDERKELLSDNKTYWSKEEVQRDARRASEIKQELERRSNEDV